MEELLKILGNTEEARNILKQYDVNGDSKIDFEGKCLVETLESARPALPCCSDKRHPFISSQSSRL